MRRRHYWGQFPLAIDMDFHNHCVVAAASLEEEVTVVVERSRHVVELDDVVGANLLAQGAHIQVVASL